MRRLRAVVRKEFKEILANRYTVVVSVALSLFFGMMYALQGAGASRSPSPASPVFVLSSVVGLFLSYTFAGQLFYREKVSGTIETLLCSPIGLRMLWAGKVVAVALPASVLALVASALEVVIVSVRSGAAATPSGPVILHVLIVVPLFNATLAGLLGFAQMLLGMRENRLIGFVVFIPLFAALYGIGFSGAGQFAYGWSSLGALAGIAVVLLAAVGFLSRFLSRERIVITLP